MIDSVALRIAIIAVVNDTDIEAFSKPDVLKVLCRELGYAEGRERLEREAMTGKREKIND